MSKTAVKLRAFTGPKSTEIGNAFGQALCIGRELRGLRCVSHTTVAVLECAVWMHSRLVPIFVPIAVFLRGMQRHGEGWKARIYGLSSLSETRQNVKIISGVWLSGCRMLVELPGRNEKTFML